MVYTVEAPHRKEINKSIIFLAGPIQGADNWQKDAIEILKNKIDDIIIANPRNQYLDEKFDYNKQVDWETEFLNKAGENGVILFWLANEKKHNCKRAYAQTTRFELAEWKTKHQFNKEIQIVLGIDNNFSNSRYIRKRFYQDCPEIEIFDSLEETCDKAAKLIMNKRHLNKYI